MLRRLRPHYLVFHNLAEIRRNAKTGTGKNSGLLIAGKKPLVAYTSESGAESEEDHQICPI